MLLLEWLRAHSSLSFLLASNFFALVLAIVLQAPIGYILLSYWLQSVIIGGFTFFRILFFNASNAPLGAFGVLRIGGQLFLAVFFALHYGGFHFGYLIFIGALLFAEKAPFSLWDILFVLLTGVAFFANHLYSFFRYKNEMAVEKNVMEVFSKPYARIVPMHLTILFGFMLYFFFQTSWIVIALFMVLKTLTDVRSHAKEHGIQIPWAR